MGSPSIRVEIAPSWRRAVRGAVYDALFTGYRGYWLIRLGYALLLAAAGHALLGRMFARTNDLTAIWLASVFLALPLGWFLYPILRGRSSVGSALTILDEGVTVDAKHSSLSVSWSAVRAVRRTLWDLVIVLDGACICMPLAALVPGTMDSVRDRFRRSGEAPREEGVREDVPYRTAETRPPGPEDEDATPQEWRAPSPYRFSVVAFPTRAHYVLALLSLKRRVFLWPGIMLGAGALMLFLGAARSSNDGSMLTSLTVVGLFTSTLAMGIQALVLSPALFALRGRFGRECRAGVLYAVGPSGLYLRTHSFERRDHFGGISELRVSRNRVAIGTGSVIHAIPRSAFASEQDRKSFVNAIQSELRT